MKNELRFTDPAFSCEVLIRGVHTALYQAAVYQFECLKNIRNLGLIGHFEDTGVHTKHHHLIGLMRLFEKLLLQPEGYGLPKEFLWSFWPRVCYRQTGHAAFGYDAEKAVLLACHVDRSCRQRFVEFLQPVVDEAAECIERVSTEEKKAVISKWLDRLVEENHWQRVCNWIAAKKMIQNQYLRGILEDQTYNRSSNKPGFSWSKAILILIDPESKWNDAMRRLARLDYVVRDLHLTGRIGVTLDVDRLIANVNQADDPDWLLVKHLNSYLERTLYESVEHQTESAIFRRTMASLLISRKVNLTELFGTDVGNYLSDEAVVRLFHSRKQGKELFNDEIRYAWQTWRINGTVQEGIAPLKLERRLSGRRQGNAILTDPSNKRIIVYQLRQPNSIALSIRFRDASDRPSPSDFFHACKRFEDELFPLYQVSDLHRTLVEGLCGCRVINGLYVASKLLSQVNVGDTSILSKAAKFVVGHGSKHGSETENAVIVKAGVEQSLDKALPLRIMQTVFSSSEDKRVHLGMNLENAQQILWLYIMQWQNRFFRKPPAKPIQNLLEATQKTLHQRIIADEESKGTDLELYILLESLLHPLESVRFRLSLLNTTLLSADGQKENEYDVISFVLKPDNKVEFWIWGATTDEKFNKKRADDMQKIQKLKDKIGQRWSGEIRTPHAYVHVEKDQIKLEIDNRQETR